MISSLNSAKEIIKSLGIVFGDIGTSPIYTLTVAFAVIPATEPNVIGILSLIIWTLILLVTVQYAWLAMSLAIKGEGGTIVLREILIPTLKKKKHVALVTFLAFLGISFFIGDGVITPAISILSAVEGLEVIPGLAGLSQKLIILISCIITIGLFILQKKGTEKVSMAFGPIMFVWFCALAISGALYILQYPAVLKAINPYYALNFMLSNKILGFVILSKVILCATGGEALYADMGHIGRTPIISAWALAFTSLLLTYLGQGAFLILNPNSVNIFYEMIFSQCNILYIPFLLLSILATIIASQAMISGIFSIVYQGIMTNIMPKLHVEYTSSKLMTQIYIPAVNYFLLSAVLFVILKFKYSYNLASAYGLAASGTMTITAILLTWIFKNKKEYFKSHVALLVLIVNIMFLCANTYKIPQGAYWSLIISSVPLTLILIYASGQRKLYKSLSPLSLDEFLENYKKYYPKITNISGTAIYLSKKINSIPTYIDHTMFINNIIYEDNIILCVNTKERPFGTSGVMQRELAPGLRVFEVNVGYMEIMNLESILKQAHLQPKVIFYGVEEITTKNIVWKIYMLIKKLTPSFVQFYKLPSHKLHGVMVRVEM